MRNIFGICLISLLLTIGTSSAANIHFQVYGLSRELEKNVHAYLSSIQKDEIKLDGNFYNIENAIRQSLKALGYYEPVISFKLSSFVKRKNDVLVICINPGEPVRVSKINIVLRGEARSDQDYLNLLNKQPSLGTVLNHGDYDSFKKSLTNISLQKGYFDGQFNKSQLGCVPKKYQAFWDIDYDSGQRYRFGTTIFEGSQIRNEYLKNLIPFKEGDYYDSRELVELSHRLSSTGWFSSIVIKPEFDKSRKSKILPLHGIVSPRIENAIETGIGYSTNVGPRVNVSWKKPWMNSYGHSLTARASISTLEQKLDFNYKIPILKKPLEQYYLVKSEFKRTGLNDTKLDSTTFFISRYLDLSNNWQQSINLKWSLNHFTKESITNTTMLLYSGVMINRTRFYGAPTPNFIYSQYYSIDYSNTAWGSDINFLVLQAQNVLIKKFFDKHRFIIRGNFGWIESKNINKIPPDLRFFDEGDRSIRGYNRKPIYWKNDSRLIRASKLVIGSLEYQYNFIEKWWGAIFIDNGKLVTNIHDNNFKTGAGFGARLESRIGMIKFDFALPVNHKKEERGFQFYVSVEPDL